MTEKEPETVVLPEEAVLFECSDLEAPTEPEQQEGKLLADTVEGSMLFADIPVPSWFAPYVEDLVEQDVVTGYKDDSGKLLGIYAPAQAVSIVEVLKMALESVENPATVATVPQNASAQGTWAAPYVARAEELDYSFLADLENVHAPATRGLAIQIFAEVAGVDVSAVPLEQLYKDVKPSMKYANAIYKATYLCWVQGDTDKNGNLLHTFRPTDNMNRAEVSKVLSVILARQAEAQQ